MSDCKNSLILSNKNFCHCLIVAEFLQYLDKSWDPYCLFFPLQKSVQKILFSRAEAVKEENASIKN